ncbi:hypothetical protein BDE27_3195 [Xenorhabdus ehlersii]|uniref:Uncharacterized protein n=1 Tax=Xenorhabdus ehlersii TaxID=290111 RepID=A0A2D0IVP1_9GAMM|nr:hypothetical protein [Xenorhabdus sp. TS4]PHM26001.1 hypothetical protein Xehl_01060 [Xenorhabdus ehlersii]RKE88558.1 hypothetical protein BDE27_3195 [Xenorhabdus ehlersii]
MFCYLFSKLPKQELYVFVYSPSASLELQFDYAIRDI